MADKKPETPSCTIRRLRLYFQVIIFGMIVVASPVSARHAAACHLSDRHREIAPSYSSLWREHTGMRTIFRWIRESERWAEAMPVNSRFVTIHCLHFTHYFRSIAQFEIQSSSTIRSPPPAPSRFTCSTRRSARRSLSALSSLHVLVFMGLLLSRHGEESVECLVGRHGEEKVDVQSNSKLVSVDRL